MAGSIVDYLSHDTTANLANGWWHLNTGDSVVVVDGGSIVENGANSSAVYVFAGASSVSITVQTLIYGEKYAIESLGTGTRIQISGSVIGNEHAISMSDGGFINVGTAGTVMSNNVTIELRDAWLTNDGLISSSLSHTITLDGGRIVNNGTIVSGEEFSIFWNGSESATIFNTGTILGDIVGAAEGTNPDAGINLDNTGLLDGSILMHGGRHDIDNSGRITGSINLADGADTVLSQYGFIGGGISTGGGNDIVVAGNEDNQIEGGTGADSLDGGGGVNTLSYTQSVRGVRIDLMTMTASHGDAGGDTIKHFSNVYGSVTGRDVINGDNNNNTLSGYIGHDKVFGNGGDDQLVALGTGNESLYGGDGNDLIALQTISAVTYGEAFTNKTTVDGGTGFDTLELADVAPVVFGATTVTNIERIFVLDGFGNYALTTHNATVGNTATLDIDATALTGTNAMSFDGSAELGGKFTFEGGDGKDTFVGGAGADRAEGGLEADVLTGGGGADTFVYDTQAESTYQSRDRVTDFLAGTDKFGFENAITGVDGPVSGAVSNGSFATDLQALCNPALLGSHAIVVNATSGTLAGHSYLVVDVNGVAGFQKAVDFVIEVTGITGALATADFTVI